MLNSSITIKTSRGNVDPIGIINSAVAAAQPTVGDLLYAGQRQRTRILDRTARGVDVDGSPFTPYSTNGPYYYYPSKNAKNRRAGAAQFARKIGLGKTATSANKRNGILGRTSVGIKFSSYAAFKASLGRIGVDLRGPSAPHMLQAIIVRVGGLISRGAEALDTSNDQPANEILLAIYGDEAERASGHNEGTQHLPRRHFFGASEVDKLEILSDILHRVTTRVRKVIGGSQ